jgi:hypothetical protein
MPTMAGPANSRTQYQDFMDRMAAVKRCEPGKERVEFTPVVAGLANSRMHGLEFKDWEAAVRL